MSFLKIFINTPAGHVPKTSIGLVLNVCPVDGDVMITGFVGLGSGTTAFTVYEPLPVVAALVDHDTLANITPMAKTKNTNKAYDVSR